MAGRFPKINIVRHDLDVDAAAAAARSALAGDILRKDKAQAAYGDIRAAAAGGGAYGEHFHAAWRFAAAAIHFIQRHTNGDAAVGAYAAKREGEVQNAALAVRRHTAYLG